MHFDDFRWMARQNRDTQGWRAIEAKMPDDSFPTLSTTRILNGDQDGVAAAQIKQARADFFLSLLPSEIKQLTEQGEWLRYPNEFGRVIYNFYGPTTANPDELAGDHMTVELDGLDSSEQTVQGKISITHSGIELSIICVPHHEDLERRFSLSFLQGPRFINDHTTIRGVLDAMRLPLEVTEPLQL